MRKLLLVLLLIFGTLLSAQELNCNLVVNAELTGDENDQVFKTLERQLTEFVNNKQWTPYKYKNQERIDCSMVINVQEYTNDKFIATLQVQSTRPVFGSTYSTPLYNFNDTNFSFQYIEFQNLIYNENRFETNLVSVIAYHIYMILGIDAETFAPRGGEDYFKQAQAIVNYSQQVDSNGWKPQDGLQTRFTLIDQILSTTYKEYRTVLYDYHRLGLDLMHNNPKEGKEQIIESIADLRTMNNRRPNSFVLRTFFDAKASEIEQLFSDGPSVNITDLIDSLNRIAPTHASKWRNISF